MRAAADWPSQSPVGHALLAQQRPLAAFCGLPSSRSRRQPVTAQLQQLRAAGATIYSSAGLFHWIFSSVSFAETSGGRRAGRRIWGGDG